MFQCLDDLARDLLLQNLELLEKEPMPLSVNFDFGEHKLNY